MAVALHAGIRRARLQQSRRGSRSSALARALPRGVGEGARGARAEARPSLRAGPEGDARSLPAARDARGERSCSGTAAIGGRSTRAISRSWRCRSWRSGYAVAVVNYDLCPDVSIATIVDESDGARSRGSRAKAPRMARMPERSSSAGIPRAAISSRCCSRRTGRRTDLARDPFSGGVSLSGVHDLAPMVQYSFNADFKLDDARSGAAFAVASFAAVARAARARGRRRRDVRIRPADPQSLWDAWPAKPARGRARADADSRPQSFRRRRRSCRRRRASSRAPRSRFSSERQRMKTRFRQSRRSLPAAIAAARALDGASGAGRRRDDGRSGAHRRAAHRPRAVRRRRARHRARRRPQGARGDAHPDPLRDRHEHGRHRRRHVRRGRDAREAAGGRPQDQLGRSLPRPAAAGGNRDPAQGGRLQDAVPARVRREGRRPRAADGRDRRRIDRGVLPRPYGAGVRHQRFREASHPVPGDGHRHRDRRIRRARPRQHRAGDARQHVGARARSRRSRSTASCWSTAASPTTCRSTRRASCAPTSSSPSTSRRRR